MMRLTPEQFQEFLHSTCKRETSIDPDRWTPENPTWGHCAVVSLVAQDLFGGTFLRASLENTPFADARSHYWNVLPDGKEHDFTRAQFGEVNLVLEGKSVKDDGETIDREYLLKNPETKKRYEILLIAFRIFLAKQ